MMMYPCRRNGRFMSVAPYRAFKDMEEYNAEKGGIGVNKKEKELILKCGISLEKEDMDGGSMWIEGNDTILLKYNLENLNGLNASEIKTREIIVHFLNICISNKYSIRVY